MNLEIFTKTDHQNVKFGEKERQERVVLNNGECVFEYIKKENRLRVFFNHSHPEYKANENNNRPPQNNGEVPAGASQIAE